MKAVVCLCVLILSIFLLPVIADDLPTLYLTIVIHNEEDMSRGTIPKANIPDYDGNEALMHHFAHVMGRFAEMAAEHGARINFGSDWTFSHGAALFEPHFYSDLQALGHEIDAHAHQSSVPYHNVQEDIRRAGGMPTQVASGMNEQEIQSQLAYFDALYPDFRILWGVSLPGHTAGECVASWAWRPSRDNWTQHDPNGDYIYIGHGELVNSIQAVRQALQQRSSNRVNTIAVFTTPREFKASQGTDEIDEAWMTSTDSVDYWENRLAWWDNFLSQIDPLVDAGVIEYKTLSEIAAIFEEREPELLFDWIEIPRSNLGMRPRNIKAGYPIAD